MALGTGRSSLLSMTVHTLVLTDKYPQLTFCSDVVQNTAWQIYYLGQISCMVIFIYDIIRQKYHTGGAAVVNISLFVGSYG